GSSFDIYRTNSEHKEKHEAMWGKFPDACCTSSYAWANSFSCEWFVGSRPGMKPAMVAQQAGSKLCRHPVDPRRAGRAPSMLPRIPAVSRLFLQWLYSIPLYRPRQEPPPQEFEETVGRAASLHGCGCCPWKVGLERPRMVGMAR
ncbi:2-isopropylmalate synthase, partial [Dissostichus eleginoides]